MSQQKPTSQPDAPRDFLTILEDSGIIEHFEELRQRLIRSVFAIVGATIVALIFTPQIIGYLAGPYEGDLIILTPTGSVVMYFRVALMSGAILAMPLVTHQIFMFFLPAAESELGPEQTRKNKRIMWLALLSTTTFFVLGVAFAWFVMVPNALFFLQTFQEDVFTDQWTAEEYFSFLTAVLFWIGVAFEMPIIFFVLGRFGVVNHRQLIEQWRLAVVIITIAAALITPTIDPFNMLLVMGPLLVLYALSIVLVRFAVRQQTVN